MLLLLWLVGCESPPPPPSGPPDPCAVMAAPAPGPLAEERAKVRDQPLPLARVYIREARVSSDPGFYSLAETALECALLRTPDDLEAERLMAHVRIQFHEFAAVEQMALALTARPRPSWLDWALLGDAQMEQGKLKEAAPAYQRAIDLRPGLEMYDRVAWLNWLWGDVDGALQLQKMAASAGTPADPEPFAWVLARLGWLRALRGEPAPELDAALQLVPGYKPALLARGRIRLHAGEKEAAAADLRAVGPTVEAVWALSEIDPTADVRSVRSQDPRGFAMWLTPTDPATALGLLEEEWKVRQDATTRMARAWASFKAGDPRLDPKVEARAALETGIVEPRVLKMAAEILGEPALLERARAMGPGLLPSERGPATEAPPPG